LGWHCGCVHRHTITWVARQGAQGQFTRPCCRPNRLRTWWRQVWLCTIISTCISNHSCGVVGVVRVTSWWSPTTNPTWSTRRGRRRRTRSRSRSSCSSLIPQTLFRVRTRAWGWETKTSWWRLHHIWDGSQGKFFCSQGIHGACLQELLSMRLPWGSVWVATTKGGGRYIIRGCTSCSCSGCRSRGKL
jgi:hypothetical protein